MKADHSRFELLSVNALAVPAARVELLAEMKRPGWLRGVTLVTAPSPLHDLALELDGRTVADPFQSDDWRLGGLAYLQRRFHVFRRLVLTGRNRSAHSIDVSVIFVVTRRDPG